METTAPRDRFLLANRLQHHLLEWGDTGPRVLLLHGFLEHAHAWDLVAPAIAAAGYRVAALDWRGHGDSGWVGEGGYYHFADYVADLAFVTRALEEPVALIAHSMGGGAAVLYAGTEPRQVWALVSVEGLGLSDSPPESAPDRYQIWLRDLERAAQRPVRRMSLEDAAMRIRERFPRFSERVVAHMAERGTKADGEARVWKFDPLHQTMSPQPYYVAQARAFWRRVACGVLYVEGSETPLRLAPAELDERLGILRAERISIDGSGHHPHLEQPTAFADAVIAFLQRQRR